jgi:hypothetical protein
MIVSGDMPTLFYCPNIMEGRWKEHKTVFCKYSQPSSPHLNRGASQYDAIILTYTQ